MAKYLIVSDIQADSYERLSTLTDEGITSRLADVVKAFDAAVTDGVAKGCTSLVMLGDIFDNRTSISLPVLDQMCRAVERASTVLKVHVVAGNHDSYLRSPLINSLRVFSGFATIHDHGAGTDGEVAFLPWYDSPADIEREVLALLDKAKLEKTKPPAYLFSHALLKGAAHAEVGMDPATFHPTKFKKVILGDVHAPVNIKPNIYYAGALMALHFGDAHSPRGWAILDTKTDTFTRIENTVSPRFHVIRDNTWVAGIRPIDYVRIEDSNGSNAQRLVDKAKALGAWVEANAPSPDVETIPRLEVYAAQTDDDIITKYLDYMKIDNQELHSLGVDLLNQARCT